MFSGFNNNNTQDATTTKPAANLSDDHDSFVHVMEIDDMTPQPHTTAQTETTSTATATAKGPEKSPSSASFKVEKTEKKETEEKAIEVTVKARNDVIGLDSDISKTQVCVNIKACELPDDDEDDSIRAPVDIVVALDVSGSMMGEKLDLCKTTLKLLLRELRPKDRFGLITFSDEAIIEIPTRKLSSPRSKEAAISKIMNLSTCGCTNISGGIGLAAQELNAVETPNKVSAIFLLTDGHANRGISKAEGIVELVRNCLAPNGKSSEEDNLRPPATIHTFGYGSDHDENLLRDISLVTPGGTYYFVDNDSNVASAFGDALGGILSVVAQNVVLSISLPIEAENCGAKLVDVYHENKERQMDGSYRVTLGDFYSEESRDVLCEVVLAKPLSEEVDNNVAIIPHVSASVSFLDTIHKKLSKFDSLVCHINRPLGSEVSTPNHHVVVQWLRVQTSRAMKEAQELAKVGNLEGARTVIHAMLDQLSHKEQQHSEIVIQMISDLNAILSGLSSRQDYETYGCKVSAQKYQSNLMQRCTESSDVTANVYRNKKKAAKAFFFKASLGK